MKSRIPSSEAQAEYRSKVIARREALCRAALLAAVDEGEPVVEAVQAGRPIWIKAFAPLTPTERTYVLNALRAGLREQEVA